MDRALDPELLGQALGQHERLPSPEELSELLAAAELGLLLREPEIPEELILTGWYLHAVASSKYMLRTYGVSRQRAAFGVAGHIFDLLSQRSGLDRIEWLKYCFAAQLAYLRSKLDPNALAIYHREFFEDLSDVRLLTHFREVALSCGVALLGFDVGYVDRVTRSVGLEINNLQKAWDVEDVFSTPFGSAAGVALGSRELMRFLVYGGNEKLEHARSLLLRAVLSEPSAEDKVSRWVAAHLLNLADDLENSSIWTALPPDIPPDVRRAFVFGSPRILTLWPPQLDLLGRAEESSTNPLSSEVKRLFLSTPTSGGKTLLAQLLVVSHLAMENTSVCYVAPTRSLCREIRKSIESRLRFVGVGIADGLPRGDWFDDLLDFEPQVEVMTPERLSYLLRADSSRVLDRFGMFVFDEVHMIGEPSRGWTLEEDLTYLHYATQGKSHRIILMSAAVGNRNQFFQWMTGGENEPVHRHSDWRGPRRLHAIWTAEPDSKTSIEEPTSSAKFPRRRRCKLYGVLDARISHTGRTHRLRRTEPIGQLVYKISVDGKTQKEYGKNKSTPLYRMLIPIIQHLSQAGPVLIIESTRRRTVRMAEALADEQSPIERPEIQPLVDLVEAQLGPKHPLWRVLRKGVAYHHGSLPREIRMGIQEAVAEGHLGFLVATTTMTEGVNLPVRSVVIASQGSYGPEGYTEYITGSKLINAIGRAGRATKETEGVVVLVPRGKPSPADLERLSPDMSEMKVTSMLATEKALDALADFEEIQRTAEDAVFEVAKGAVSDFIAFVWFVAAELERIGELPTQKSIQDMLCHTLGWVQLDTTQQARWLFVANLTLVRYGGTNPSSRRRWSASGTSISSAREIESIAKEIAEALKESVIPQDPLEVVDLIVGEGRLQRILRLPEAPDRRVFSQRGGNREEIEIRLDTLLHQWLQGVELVTLAGTYFNAVADIGFRFEQLGDLINDYFEVFFPWVFGTMITWTNSLLQEIDAQTLLPTTASASVRLGVGNLTALKLMLQGLQSRSLALKIATAWESEKREGDTRSWIRTMDLADWQQTFKATIPELRALLEFSRDQRGGVAIELIRQGTAEIEVKSKVTTCPPSAASLKRVDDSPLSTIGVWVRGDLVGQVLSRDQADTQSLLLTGLILSVRFSASSGKGLLHLRLVDPAV